MTVNEASAVEIQRYIQDLVNDDPGVIEDGLPVRVGLPTKLQEPDSSGSNWIMGTVGNRAGHASAVCAAIRAAKAKFPIMK